MTAFGMFKAPTYDINYCTQCDVATKEGECWLCGSSNLVTRLMFVQPCDSEVHA